MLIKWSIEGLIDRLIWKAFNGVVIGCTSGAWELNCAWVNIKLWQIKTTKLDKQLLLPFARLCFWITLLLPYFSSCLFLLLPELLVIPNLKGKWPSCCRGLCPPRLYPSCFSSAVREQRRVTVTGCAAAASTAAFSTTVSAAQIPTLTSLEPRVAAQGLDVFKMYSDEHVIVNYELQVWRHKQNIPVCFKQLGDLQITRQGDTGTWDQTAKT